MAKKSKPKAKPKPKPKKGQVRETAPSLKTSTEKQTKNQILRSISELTGLAVRDVKEVFVSVNLLARSHLVKKGSGEFTIPEMGLKIVRKTKPATKKKQGRNPLTGESITIPAKPKREVIKVRVLKSLKGVVE